MLKISTLTEMKNTFEGLINGLDTAEDRTSELEDMSVETWKTENLTGKRKKSHNIISKNFGKTTKGITYI